MLIDITSESWADAAPQADDIAQFIERVEAGTFEFSWLWRRARPRLGLMWAGAGGYLECELGQAAGAAAAAVA